MEFFVAKAVISKSWIIDDVMIDRHVNASIEKGFAESGNSEHKHAF